MDFNVPQSVIEDRERFQIFLKDHMVPHLPSWMSEGVIPRHFFRELGTGGWLAYDTGNGSLTEQPTFKQAVLFEALARISPGVAVAVLVQISLGSKGLALFASPPQKEKWMPWAAEGKLLVCLGNTEPSAGSDVAGIEATAREVDGGWVLNGTKAYVTNGAIAHLGLITAVTDPQSGRNRRMSMFVVDLSSEGVSRRKLNKQVWIPSDLTRLTFKDVFVPAENLLGERGHGLQQVLEIFTHSRLTISAMTLGTAAGAFDLGLSHARRREIFGSRVVDMQAKSFEAAEFFSRIEAARLVLWKACWTRDQGLEFRLEASMAKYLTVQIAREVSLWAADLFGAASVIHDHPIHKFPMDAWASSLGEGTQDVQKLIIFRELMKNREGNLGAGVKSEQ